MTSQQPAEHLARTRRQFPLWSIRPTSGGVGWTGHRGTRRVWAATLDGLEVSLRDAERAITVDPYRALLRLREQHSAWRIAANPAGWSAEHREGTRLHYLFALSAAELADKLSRTEP